MSTEIRNNFAKNPVVNTIPGIRGCIRRIEAGVVSASQMKKGHDMGLVFGSSLHHLFERISEPVHDFFTPVQQKADSHHEMMWDCYLSGQMSDADLDREINADPSFAAFVQAREKQFH